jgi:hypothetical protein
MDNNYGFPAASTSLSCNVMLVRMPSQQSNVCSRVRWGDGRCCSMCTSVPKPTLFWKHKMHFYRLKATLNGTHDPVHLKMPSRLRQTRRVKSSFATASPSRTSSFTKPAIRDGLEQGYVGRSTTFDKLRRPNGRICFRGPSALVAK